MWPVISLLVLFVFIALVIVSLIYLNNDLIAKKNQIDRSFSTIDVLLKKRCDLIPNLVAVAQQYMLFEKETLTNIAGLRSRALSGRMDVDRRVEIENQISKALSDIMVTVESYPDLKTDGQFRNLQASLNEAEEQLSAARRFYNTSVNDYNNAVEMFPSNLLASRMHLRTRRLFEATEQERQNVDVRQMFRS
jgi:LemA protein